MSARRRAVLVVLLAAAVPNTGCLLNSTRYTPQPRGRQLSLVVDDNQLAVAGEGRTTTVGWFGGGLVERVADQPDAARAARSYRRRKIGAFIAGAPSGLCLVGGAIYYVDELREQGEGYQAPLGFDLLMLGCLGGALVSEILDLSARPYLYAAVNLYNDRVDAARAIPAE